MLAIIGMIHDEVGAGIAQDRAMAGAAPSSTFLKIIGLQYHQTGAVTHAPAVPPKKGTAHLPGAAAGGVIVALRTFAAEIIGWPYWPRPPD